MSRSWSWSWSNTWTWLALAASIQPAYTDFVSTDYTSYNDGDLGHRPHLEFHSSPEYAPVLQANVWNHTAISSVGSHIFLRHDGNETSPLSSPLILDATDLSAVYLNRTFRNVFGTRVQKNFGTPYLTFWEGEKGEGIGDGYGLAFDESYRLVYKVWAQNLRVHSDLHEFAFTGNGTALVTGVNKLFIQGKDYDSSWGVPYQLELLDAVFQELDLETNDVVFEWRALDHINPMESYEPRANGWDAYHMNSIEKVCGLAFTVPMKYANEDQSQTDEGNYLVSIRHTHSIILINGQTGDIIWTLGGRQNDFVEIAANTSDLPPVLTTAWQHHARFVPGTNQTQMTLFDNHVKVTSHAECDNDCSRGLHIALDTSVSPPTVQLLSEFQHPTRLQAQSQGSVQVLEQNDGVLGNVFIGWGRCPTFTEHGPDGETVMDVQFSPWHSAEIPDALDNYRAYKMDWVGIPWWDPVLVAKRGSTGELLVYVSWNGATEVSKWVVKGFAAGSSKSEVLASSRRTGFETKMMIEEVVGTGKKEREVVWERVWAEAMDVKGNLLRSSEIVNLTGVELDVAVDTYDEYNSTFASFLAAEKSDLEEVEAEHEEKNGGLSKFTVAFLASGITVFVLGMSALGAFWWYRRREYNRLDANDFALESDKFVLDSEDEYSDEEGDARNLRNGESSYSRPPREGEESQGLVSGQHS